jgi:hypothetical protein
MVTERTFIYKMNLSMSSFMQSRQRIMQRMEQKHPTQSHGIVPFVHRHCESCILCTLRAIVLARFGCHMIKL